MRAHAMVVAGPSPGGGCSFSRLRSDPPLLLRPTPFGLHLQGGAAGPLGGDQLRLDMHLTVGARLSVRTVAASIVLPGPNPSELEINVRVDDGAHLDWCPEPLVSVVGSRHRQRVFVELATTATFRWHETIVLGRTDEPPGTLDTRTRIERAGEVLLHQDQRLGDPDDPDAWRSPAVVDGARTVTTTIVVGCGEAAPSASDAGSATFAIADDAWLTQVVGEAIGR